MYRSPPRSGPRHSVDDDQPHAALPGAASGGAGKLAALATIVLLAAWAGSATLYILFRDDALKLIVERQVAMTRAYETQAIQRQAEIDRLRSLKLLDQERVDRMLSELVRRQSALVSRQSALSAMAAAKPAMDDDGPAITGSASSAEPALDAAPAKPSPLSDTILIAAPTERHARLESRPLPPLGSGIGVNRARTATEVRLGNLAQELQRIERAQGDALIAIEEYYDGRQHRMRRVFSDLGLDQAASVGVSSGGPFLPWSRPPEDPFARQLHLIRIAAKAVEAMQREIAAVPLRRPMAGQTGITSAFGVRLDPFVRQLAMHTGVDFAGEPGDPVRATATGTVVQAERNGGYGLMVEVDHGNGITTRYAHMSALSVAAGEAVAAGARLGRVGSTGRSTGPHLHYEVRVNGEPVDPQKYLRAGLRLRDPI